MIVMLLNIYILWKELKNEFVNFSDIQGAKCQGQGLLVDITPYQTPMWKI
jgi:hypothetical protein